MGRGLDGYFSLRRKADFSMRGQLCSFQGPAPEASWSHSPSARYRPPRRALTVFGGYSEGETPLPIPNREVKPLSADGTWPARAWESRSPPAFDWSRPPGRLFLCQLDARLTRLRIGSPNDRRSREDRRLASSWGARGDPAAGGRSRPQAPVLAGRAPCG